jgi:hypothetical protein
VVPRLAWSVFLIPYFIFSINDYAANSFVRLQSALRKSIAWFRLIAIGSSITLVIAMTMAKMDLKPNGNTKESKAEPVVPKTEVPCYDFSRSGN